MSPKLKLIITLTLAAFLILTPGCQEAEPDNNEEPQSNGEEENNGGMEGTYSAASEADDRGYVYADVTFTNDEVTEVELTEYNDMGMEKDEEYGWDPWHEAMDELPDRFVEANSADIEAYTEATSTSNKAMGAVEKAIEQAEAEEAGDEIDTFDGTFMGNSEVDEQSGWGIAWVTLENEEITEVQLEEVQIADEEEEEDDEERFALKDDDYQWEEWHEARDTLPERFVEENAPKVEAYAGATGSSEMWMEAVEQGLENAGWEAELEDTEENNNDDEDDEEDEDDDEDEDDNEEDDENND